MAGSSRPRVTRQRSSSSLLLLLLVCCVYCIVVRGVVAHALSLREKEVAKCVCEDVSLCAPLEDNGGRPEFFGFSPVSASSNWKLYNYSILTTVAWNTEPQLVCLAHKHRTRVVLNAGSSQPPVNGTKEERSAWIQAQIELARAEHLDGINFDYEEAVRGPGALDSLNENYVQLVRETTDAFHHYVGNGTMVSVDVAWSPYNVDGRAYSYSELANASDLLFVMAYDTRSQIYHQSLASGNSPVGIAALGLRNYLDIGVKPEKIVMGFPWYGYNYTCNEGPNAIPEDEWKDTNTLCPIACEPFRGAPCSDAAGNEVNFRDISEILRNDHATFRPVAGTESYFDRVMQTPFFNVKRRDDGSGGPTFQMHYDNAQSIRAKIDAARDVVASYPGFEGEKQLRGFGVWHLDALAYVNASAEEWEETSEMWAAFAS